MGCAFVSRHITSLDDYARKKAAARDLVLAAAREITRLDVEITMNAADDIDRGDVFLTVTGTSAEAGDDGEVGRGNRPSGLITPYRWMTLEAAAGKNPVSHVGKIYNVVAGRLATKIVDEIPNAHGAACLLVSEIGRRVDDPLLAHVRVTTDACESAPRRSVEALLRAELSAIPELREALLAGRVGLF